MSTLDVGHYDKAGRLGDNLRSSRLGLEGGENPTSPSRGLKERKTSDEVHSTNSTHIYHSGRSQISLQKGQPVQHPMWTKASILVSSLANTYIIWFAVRLQGQFALTSLMSLVTSQPHSTLAPAFAVSAAAVDGTSGTLLSPA